MKPSGCWCSMKGVDAMSKRKYPRIKKCTCCGRSLFLRRFKRINLKGKQLNDWADVCLRCENDGKRVSAALAEILADTLSDSELSGSLKT